MKIRNSEVVMQSGGCRDLPATDPSREMLWLLRSLTVTKDVSLEAFGAHNVHAQVAIRGTRNAQHHEQIRNGGQF